MNVWPNVGREMNSMTENRGKVQSGWKTATQSKICDDKERKEQHKAQEKRQQDKKLIEGFSSAKTSDH